MRGYTKTMTIGPACIGRACARWGMAIARLLGGERGPVACVYGDRILWVDASDDPE